DIDQVGAFALRGDDVALPDLVEQGAGLRHRSTPSLLGFGLAAQAVARAFGDARRLAGAAAQVIELGPPHRAAPHHVDRGDPRRIEREDALDPFAVGNLAQGEVRVEPGILAGDAHPLEGLDALALAFDDLDADAHGVARLE